MELVATWVSDPDAERASEDGLHAVAGLAVFVGALGLMLLPAAISVFLLLGLLT